MNGIAKPAPAAAASSETVTGCSRHAATQEHASTRAAYSTTPSAIAAEPGLQFSPGSAAPFSGEESARRSE